MLFACHQFQRREPAALAPVHPADSPAMREALWSATASLLKPFLAPPGA
ncbi:hypothetical protein [Frateuria defendens]|nr:hypothetical protein [Frateuria defendens]